jgi:TatD DNase family protein
MIDTHCHLTFPEFVDRIDATMSAALAAGVDGVISISTTVPDAQRLTAISQQHPRLFVSAGVHPLYSDDLPEGRTQHDWHALTRAAANPKCVAWGELGLDHHYTEPARDVQVRVLQEQLATIAAARAQGVDKPIILHCREAFATLIPILRASGLPTDRMVFHCFTGTPADMAALLDIGAMVSFTGAITYKKSDAPRAALDLCPIDRIMIETDAPFLPPEPHRSARPCTPAMSRITAEFVAARKGLSWPDFHRRLNDNTHRFFGITSAT